MPGNRNQAKSKADRKKGVFHLILFIVSIAVFFMVLAPWLDRMPLAQPLIRFIDDRDIDATALYYTDIEEFSDAEIFMYNSNEYSPNTDSQ
jgi:hypothetical protein